MKYALMVVAAVAAYSLVAADTWYVNDDNYGKDGLDGKSAACAYGTIQDAIDAAKSGDTVLIAEGVYDKGLGDDTVYGKSRVYIYGKKLYLKGVGDVEKTVIQGEPANDGVYGCGEGAVRCMLVKGATAAESIIEGITFRNGFTATASTDGSTMGRSGGALCSASTTYLVNDNGPYLVGCTVENCNSARCGISNGGTFVRCLVRNSRFSPGGYFCWKSKFLNCAIVHNWAVLADDTGYGTAHFDQSTAINCTFADNYCSFYPTTPSCVYNNIVSSSLVPTGGAAGCYEGNYGDSTSARVLMGSATGDVRLRSGCVEAVKTGDATRIAEIPLPAGETPWKVDGYIDYFGNPIAAEGKIAAGCSQGLGKGVFAPAGGAVILNGIRVSLDQDRIGYGNSYFYPSVYPSAARIYPHLRPGYRIVTWYSQSEDYAALTYNANIQGTVKLPPLPGSEDALDIIPPPDADKSIRLEYLETANIKYVDPKLDDYSEADGTEEKPFKTIQEALVAGHDSKGPENRAVIICKSGTYGENQGSFEFTFNGTTGRARFTVTQGTVSRIVAEEGPERTFIVGKASESSADGCGQGAVTGFATSTESFISGFTITGCHASCEEGKSGLYTTARGGSHYTYGFDLYICDCVLTNNIGSYAALGCGQYYRCKMSGNTGKGCLVGDTVNVFSSVIAGNIVPSTQTLITQTFSTYTYFSFHLSVVGNGVNAVFSNRETLHRENCVADEGGSSTYPSELHHGCVYWGFANYPGSNYLVANPMFADKESGDLRMAKVSEGFAAGVGPSSTLASWRYCASDVNGKQMQFDDSGRPLPGAYADMADGVYAWEPAAGGLKVANGKFGFNRPDENSVLEFSAEAGSRPCAGVIVNGMTNLFENAENNIVAVTGNAEVEAYYTSDWYAAVDGDDSATGFYPSDAKTLQGALANPHLKRGDRVLACAGTYDSGTMAQDRKAEDKALYVHSRAIVPPGITLESKDGRDVTVIKGKAASVEDEGSPAGWGLGEDAVRCVMLRSGSRLKGFTICDGHTRRIVGDSGTDLSSGPETTGGGVGEYDNISFNGITTWNRNQAWMEDCIIENCYAYRGGGAMAVRSKNCIFRNNKSVTIGAGASDSCLYGSLFTENVSMDTYNNGKGVGFLYYAENCTFLDGLNTCGQYGTPGLVNCIIKCPFNMGAIPPANATNNVFASDLVAGLDDGWLAEAGNGNFAALASQLEFTAECRPKIGANVAVDRADPAKCNEEYRHDATCAQRVYNGKMDIGATEGDWRGIYAQDLGRSRQLTVDTATENVTESDAKTVLVPAGESVQARWKGSPRGSVLEYELAVRISDGAELKFFLNGEEAGSVTGDGAERVFRFKNDFEVNTLSFVCSGLTGTAELSAFRRSSDSVAILLR